jgi:SNF2 family DNA or RNA helicase
MPPIHHNQIICRTTTNIKILESLIPNDVMEMLHAGDTKGALQSLGVNDESPTSIINSLTKSLTKDLDQQRRKFEFYKTMEYSSELAKQKSLDSQQEKITSLENRIDTIKKRMEDIDTTNCPICYSDVETPTLTPCCKNLFCFVCLCESIKRQTTGNPICPLCRAEISSINDLHVVNKNANTIVEDSKPHSKTKIEEFINFVENNPKARILMFSGYDASFFQLTSEMTHRDIAFSTINGSTHRVSKIINEFSEGQYRVLLLNSRHVGAGLNITCATDVFLFHKMSSEMEKQIIGRAYRMGRTKPLNVHHLLHQNEIVKA